MENNREAVEKLVQRTLEGDDKAFEELYRLTNQSAYFVALKITKNEDDALDILQDSYIKALQKLNQLSDPGSFSAWFNQIVANSAKNYICKSKPVLFEENEEGETVADTFEDDDSDFVPEESFDSEETRKAVMEIIDSLPEDKRLCILMFYYYNMKIGDIASDLGVPENTVKNRLFDGRKKIKQRIEELRKTGSTVLGTAPAIPLFKWLLGRTAATVVASEKTAEAILALIGSSSAIIACTATGGAAITAGAAVATGTALGAAGATGVAGAAATAVAGLAVPKIIALVVAGTVVVSGAAVGTKVVKDKIEERATTQPVTEEVGEISQENKPANAPIHPTTSAGLSQEKPSNGDTSQAGIRQTENAVTVTTKKAGVTATVTGNGTTGVTVTVKNPTTHPSTVPTKAVTTTQPQTKEIPTTVKQTTTAKHATTNEETVTSAFVEVDTNPVNSGEIFLFTFVKKVFNYFMDIINPIYVEYQRNGDSVSIQKKRGFDLIIKDDSIFELSDPGSIFVCWKDDKGKPYKIGYVYKTNQTLHLTAVYMHTVTYTDGCDGTLFSNKAITCEEGTITPPFGEVPLRAGYEFAGWSPKISLTVTDNIVYTAQWVRTFYYNIIVDEAYQNVLEIIRYAGSATDVTIPITIDGMPVVKIGNEVFKDNDDIISVTVPDSISAIGSRAFYGCTSLTNINIPNSLTSIGNYAFYSCTSLPSINILNSVTSIGSDAFNNCDSLVNINIPNSVTNIGSKAFYGCDKLASITVESGSTQYNSFDGVLFNFAKTELLQYPIGNARAKYIIPNSVKKVNSGAFSACKNLTEIEIPDNTCDIAADAFDNCGSSTIICSSSSYAKIYAIDNDITYRCTDVSFLIDGETLKSYTGTAINVNIPSTIKEIDSNAFLNSKVTAVVIPDGVTTIDDYAFGGCHNLVPIVIPDSVKSIGNYAFSNSTSVVICCNPGSAAEVFAINNNIPYRMPPTSASVDGVYIVGANAYAVTSIDDLELCTNTWDLDLDVYAVYSDGTEILLTPDQYVIEKVYFKTDEDDTYYFAVLIFDGKYQSWFLT